MGLHRRAIAALACAGALTVLHQSEQGVDEVNYKDGARSSTVTSSFLSLIGVAHAQKAPTSREVLADQVRSQGYPCDRALSAERDAGASRPDEQDWVLKCTNGSYRIRLIPDMAAKVEKID